MSWEKVKAGVRDGNAEPYVSFTKNNVAMSSGLMSQAGLRAMKSVDIYVDPEGKKVAFDFKKDTAGEYKVTAEDKNGSPRPILLPRTQLRYDWIEDGRYTVSEEDDMIVVDF